MICRQRLDKRLLCLLIITITGGSIVNREFITNDTRQ